MKRCPLISRVFNAQIALTKAQWEDNLLLKQQIINNSLEIQNLLSKFKMPSDTLRGNCVDYIDIDGEKISTHYLQLLHTHSVLSQEINFSEVRGFFEIGGGFGANIHLLVENYPNIKKFIYLDISPNLYVAAQYLKSFYGSAVKLFLDKEDTIFFLADDSLEILCILPEQIEKLNVEIDCFYNAHSFVEMPEKTVQMYIKNINRMLSKKNNSSIALVSYDGFELNTTFDPDNLTGFFEKKMSKRVIGSLFNPDRNYFYFTYKS